MPATVQSPEPHVSEELIKRLHHITVRGFLDLDIKTPFPNKRIYVFHHDGWRYEVRNPHIVKASSRKAGKTMVINTQTDQTTQLTKVMLEIVHKILADRPT